MKETELLRMKEKLEAARARACSANAAYSATAAAYAAGRVDSTAYGDATCNFSTAAAKFKSVRAAYEATLAIAKEVEGVTRKVAAAAFEAAMKRTS